MNRIFDHRSIVCWLAIDWADRQHLVAYQGADWPENKKRIIKSIKHNSRVICEFVLQLRREFPNGVIAIVIEQSRGGLIHALMAYDCFVFYRVNPKAFSKYRESFRGSGAKDDPSDADLLLDYVMKHPERFSPWIPEEQSSRKLRNMVEARRKLVNKRGSLTNQITSQLKNYFPEVLDWVGDLAKPLACQFLLQWPTLQALKSQSQEKIREFYLQHRCRKRSLIEKRLAEIFRATPFVTDDAIVSPSMITIQACANLVAELTHAIKNFDQQIHTLFQQHPDRHIYESFPGTGPVLRARLAALMGTDRNRWQSAAELQRFAGVAPVTRSSGSSSQVVFRLACPKFLRQTLQEFAACSIPVTPWAKAYYQQQRKKQKKHHAAVRALAFKWCPIIFYCWKNRALYDNTKVRTARHLL